ncbi:CpsD/CapB family tyrosine-protein kinase [Romboutsia sp.]|uniref:CpsD/CapB family tyrosine-protein kinase n=1 Tax=Romboutsia sp. TaxID=1965302 RepID=UPI003F2F1F89
MNRLITLNNPKSPISEIYRGIRTSIEFSNLDKNIKVINITSSKPNEGKTTIISNLAVSFANLEKKVLIIDGDLRNPGVHKMFGISNIIGLTDVLVGSHNFVECVHCTDTKNLHVLTCGPVPPNPSEMLASNKMKKFIEEMREEYDYVFIDSPPIGLVTDAGIIGGYSDGCIFVVGAQETNIDVVKMAKEKLDSVGVNIIGSVLNKYAVKKSTQGYYDYYYLETRSSKRKSRKENRRRKKEEKSMG